MSPEIQKAIDLRDQKIAHLSVTIRHLRAEIVDLTDRLQAECNHDWEFCDDSFDHEFGTEVVRYDRCDKCGKTRSCEARGESEPDTDPHSPEAKP